MSRLLRVKQPQQRIRISLRADDPGGYGSGNLEVFIYRHVWKVEQSICYLVGGEADLSNEYFLPRKKRLVWDIDLDQNKRTFKTNYFSLFQEILHYFLHSEIDGIENHPYG